MVSQEPFVLFPLCDASRGPSLKEAISFISEFKGSSHFSACSSKDMRGIVVFLGRNSLRIEHRIQSGAKGTVMVVRMLLFLLLYLATVCMYKSRTGPGLPSCK